MPEVESGPLLPVPSTSSGEHELSLVEGLRRYRSMQASVASAYAGLEGAYGALRATREGGVPDKVAQIIDRIDLEADEEDGEARRSECPPATAPTSPTAVGGSGVEDALRAENACHKRLRVLDRELQDLVAGLCRDYGALEGRREPLDDVSYWSFVHGTAKALDAVEKDFDLKRRIVARTDWRTPEEDSFVYGALRCPWSLSCARGTLRGRGGGLGRARQAREAKRTPSSLFWGNCCTHTNFIVVLHRPATCPCALTSSRASFGWGKADSILSIHPAIQPVRGGRETRAWGRTTKKKQKNVHRGRLHVGRYGLLKTC